MTDKEFKRLSRSQLIEIIYQLQIKQEELTADNEKLSKALEDRRLLVSEAGNIAEAALVIHGGTIMNIMEAYADRARPFYEWHVKNGGGYEIEIDTDLWKRDKREVILLSSILEG